MLDELRQHVSLDDAQSVVNPFGVPLDKFQPGRHRAAEHATFRLLYVTEYADYKNLTTLFRALLTLRQQGVEDLQCVTPAHPSHFPEGESVTRETDTQLASHPLLAPLLRFTGSVPYAEIQSLYQQSDLFVFPSLVESFGHPLVEAMASGLPVLASDTPINREMCGDVAEYFEPLDPNDLARKILRLKADGDARRRMGEAGRSRVQEQFDWNDHVRRLVGLMKGAVAKGTAAR